MERLTLKPRQCEYVKVSKDFFQGFPTQCPGVGMRGGWWITGEMGKSRQTE